MTPKERAAMQQALEVLRLAKNSHGIMLMSDPPKDAWRFHDVDLKLVAAITALQEALAEPDMNLNCKSVQARLATSWGYVKAEQAEQEPVAVGKVNDQACIDWFEGITDYEAPVGATLYAAPVRTKDLTDGEIADLIRSAPPMDSLVDIARSVIAADREKNK